MDIINQIKKDHNGEIKYKTPKSLKLRIKRLGLLFFCSLPFIIAEIRGGAHPIMTVVNSVAILYVSLSIFHQLVRNDRLKRKYPHAFAKLAERYGIKLRPDGNPPVANPYIFSAWNEWIYSCVEELECHRADPSYPISPLSYNKYFNRKAEYTGIHKVIEGVVLSGLMLFCVSIVILFIWTWIEYSFDVAILGVMFISLVGGILLYTFEHTIGCAIDYFTDEILTCNPTIMSSIATMEGIDLDKIDYITKLSLLFINRKLLKYPPIIIKPYKEQYISLLEKYPNGVQKYVDFLSEDIQYRQVLVKETAGKNNKALYEVLKAERILCNLLDAKTFSIMLHILDNEKIIRIYENNYAEAYADDMFLNFAKEVHDYTINYFASYLPEWSLKVSNISYQRNNYDGSQSEVVLSLIDIAYYTSNDNEWEDDIANNQQRLETSKQLCLGKPEKRISILCNTIPGFHILAYNKEKHCENGSFPVSEIFINSLKQPEPNKRPCRLNNISELDNFLQNESKHVIINIDHFLNDESDELLQKIIQNRTYVIGIHNRNSQENKKGCQIKTNVNNYLGYLPGLRYLYLYSYIPVGYENNNNFHLTNEEFMYRNKILSFKKIGIAKAAGTYDIYEDLKMLLTESFDGVENTMFFFVPSKKDSNYSSRHKCLNELLVRDFHVTTSFKLVKYLEDGCSAREGGEAIPAQLYWGKCFFKDKQIIIFDDIITSGRTVLHYKSLLESWGARVIACVSLGKTIYSHEPNPIDEIKRELCTC